jgi:hypothetical protein
MSENIIEIYLKAAKDFVEVARSANDLALSKKPSPDEWSGAFIVHHMADFEIHFSHRFLRILTEDSPKIESYDEALYPTALKYESRNVEVSLNNISTLRTFIYETINNLDISALSRPVIHPVKGEITLKEIMQYANGHLIDHTEQLKKVIA